MQLLTCESVAIAESINRMINFPSRIKNVDGWILDANHASVRLQKHTGLRRKTMKKVRSSVFETNSSSTHSLVIADDVDLVLSPIPEHMIYDGVYPIFTGEYGWEQETYYDLDSKASYLATDAIMRIKDASKLDVNDRSVFESSKELMLLEEAFREFAGVGISIQKNDSAYYPYGYIDHESFGLCYDVWNAGVKGVIRFLFSDKSHFETDNDNH